MVMGVGIWAAHFIGMLALRFPIRLTYDLATTLVSLAIAVGMSGAALACVGRSGGKAIYLIVAGVLLGLGIAGMHYTGVASINIVPGITYNPAPLVVSVAIAWTMSCAALCVAFGSDMRVTRPVGTRFVAAGLLGSAIGGLRRSLRAAASVSIQRK